jgi:transposase-like protein
MNKKEREMPICPNCDGTHIVKNGFVYYEKQNFKCKKCGRQFVENGQQNQINDETKKLIDKLLLEKVPLAGIARDFRDMAAEIRQ